MDDFKTVQQELQLHLAFLFGNHTDAFVTDADGYKLWDLYLDSFPPGTNEIYRERREYDCNTCKQFVRKFGNVVFITEKNTMLSVWDFETKSEVFKPVLKALSDYVHNCKITDFYLSSERKIGAESNFEISDDGGQRKWEHLFTNLSSRFV